MSGYKDKEEPSCVHERCLPARWALAFQFLCMLIILHMPCAVSHDAVNGSTAINHYLFLMVIV